MLSNTLVRSRQTEFSKCIRCNVQQLVQDYNKCLGQFGQYFKYGR